MKQLLLFIVCFIVSFLQANHDEYDSLASQSFLSSPCLEYSTPIWKYRYCHKDYIEQYSDNPIRHLLGSYSTLKEDKSALIYRYQKGDDCGGFNRSAIARLSCSGLCGTPGTKTHISSITEPQTCVYYIEICASSLCNSSKQQQPQPPQINKQPTKKYRMDQDEKLRNLDRIKEIFYHSYESYLKYAFPLDELKPLSCVGVNTDLTPGGMLTLIDALDTLATIGNVTEFHRVIRILSANEKTFFKVDKKISVFETTIRILGGLLSAHLLCVDSELGLGPKEYDGALLRMAKELGDHLLPAFQTSTTIPYGTVNLMHGVPIGETTEACTAAAGSLSLEFGMLSILTGEPKYGRAARSSMQTLFDLRSSLNLLGRHVDANSGRWTEPIAGIGSNIDSVYEYYLKQYILFGDEEALEWFEILYEGVIRHLRMPEGNRFYHEVDMKNGKVVRRFFSSLQAFWPGVQILAGDVAAATKTLNAFMSIWDETGFVPEDFDLVRWSVVRGATHSTFLLRPELPESVFYAFQATKDESWLEAGKHIIDSVKNKCFVSNCGYSSIEIEEKKQLDSMPSFFLSEWIKYLFLLFDENNFLNQGNWIFTTEAHPFRVTNQTQNSRFFTYPSIPTTRTKSERKKRFSSLDPLPGDIPSLILDEDICKAFDGTEESYDVTLSTSYRPFGQKEAKDITFSEEKKVSGYLEDVGMFEITSTTNSFVVHRTDNGERLIISNLDSHTCMITTNDGRSPMFIPLRNRKKKKLDEEEKKSFFGSTCTFELFSSDSCSVREEWGDEIVYSGSCSVADGFGDPAWNMYNTLDVFPIKFGNNLCDRDVESLSRKEEGLPEFFSLAYRGKCSFEEKAQNAYAIGASGLMVTLLDPNDEPFVMSHASNLTQRPSIVTFLIRQQAGILIEDLIKRDAAKVRVVIADDERVSSEEGKIVISTYPGWSAVFGPMDENGLYRLSLKKQTPKQVEA